MFFCLFLISAGLGILLPILPYYIERLTLAANLTKDQVNFQIGLLTSIYPLSQLIFTAVWGSLSDKFGRKPLLIVGLSGFIFMMVLMGLATNLWMFYVARVVGGILTSSIIPVANADISDVIPKMFRKKAFSLSASAISLGVVSGPLISTALLKKNTHLIIIQTSYFKFDQFSIPFLFLSIIGIITLILVSKTFHSPPKQPLLVEEDAAENLSFVSRPLVILFFLSAVSQFGLALFESAFTIYAKENLAFLPRQMAYTFMICGLIMGIFQPIVAAIKSKKFSYKPQIIIGFGFAGLVLLILPFITAKGLVFLIIGIWAMSNSFIYPNISAQVSFQNPLQNGKNIGLQAAFNNIGQIIGPLAGIKLLSFSRVWPFFVTGLIFIIMALILIITKQWQKFIPE